MPAPLTDDSLKRLNTLARRFGCPHVIPLRRPTSIPAQIQYLDLLPTAELPNETLLPQAVAEFQTRAVIYFLNGEGQDYTRQQIESLQQRLANRGDHAVLAVTGPGDLTLYPINLDRSELQEGRWETVSATSPEAPYLFQGLACGTRFLEGSMTKADPVFAEIHRLMLRASTALAGIDGKGPLDGLTVLSMTGRALFFRFLIDRKIVCKEDLTEICPAIEGDDLREVFSNAEHSAETSVWLDETFNGDLLPLVENITRVTPPRERRRLYLRAYEEAGKKTEGEIFNHLEAILKGYDAITRQLPFPGVDWDDLNFRHIPVGVLSQVYESFSHQWDSDAARMASVHYTPKNIARFIVDQALAGIEDPHRARVLDPACGAGVFLVLAFRELVRRRWENDEKRPGTSVIHQVLYNQLCGFDISESALRLAALGLYITAIELNEIIRPPSALHVPKSLKDSVLFNHGPKQADERKKGFVLGSLGEEVSKEFDSTFDIVIGNPPWTRLKPEGENEEEKEANRKHNLIVDRQFKAIGVRVLKAAGLTGEAKRYAPPSGVPDVPFIWRAKEWVRPGGIIGFALGARLILTQTDVGCEVRNAVFKGLAITGILNGSDLEKTEVWPGIDIPWMLLWARNELPAEDHTFKLLTPIRENALSSKGSYRLDYQSAYQISVSSLIQRRWLLKALAVGSMLDVSIMDKLVEAQKKLTVGGFWKLPLVTHKGFSLEPRGKKKAPDWLLKLPLFKTPDQQTELETINQPKTFEDHFGDRSPYQTCGEDTYRRPLLIVPETPGEDRSNAKSYRILTENVCFTKSYYGYSAANHPESKLLIALLHVIIHSTLFRHFTYMRSPRVGAGRRTIYKDDIDQFPFVSLEHLNESDRSKVLTLADEIDNGSAKWKVVDHFINGMFGLTASETEVIFDTVEFNGPYRSTRLPASLSPSDQMLTGFCTALERSLAPFFKIVKQKVRVDIVPKEESDWDPPWRFVTVKLDGDAFEPTPAFTAKIMRVVAETSASRVVTCLPEGGLVLALLNQCRFWTRSRARLCGLHIAREHLAKAFPLTTLTNA